MDADAIQPRGTEVNLRASLQGREYDEIVDRIVRLRPDRVLDWGAGHGQVAHRLVERGLDVTAFDYRAGEELHTAPSPHFPDVEIHVSGDPVILPFGTGEFDVVLSLGVLEHVEDPDASLEELWRVLRPGGHFLVFKLPNRLSYLEAIAKRIGWYYHGKLPHDRVYTKRSAVSLLERHGFVVEEARRSNVLPLTVSHPVVERAERRLWRLNRALERMPGVSLLATNVECVARRPIEPTATAAPAPAAAG